MSLFNTQNSTIAEKAAEQIVEIATSQFQQLAQSGLRGYNLIWNNSFATPQEVVTALGTNAQAIFQIAQLNIQTVTEASTLGGITPPNIPSIPDEFQVTFNDDGSAVVSATSSSSSSSS